MSIDPVGELDVRADPILYQVGMRVEELRVDYQESDYELPIGPESSFVYKEATVAFPDQAGGPRFRGPRGVEIFFQKKRELVGVGHGDDLHITALVIRFHAVLLEPVAQGDILRVAELRGSYALSVKILGPVDADIVADDQRSSATGRSRDNSKRFTVGANISIDGRVRAYVGHVDGAGKEGFDGGRPGVEAGPLHFHLWSHGFFEPSVSLADHGLGVGDIGKCAYADRIARLGPRGNRETQP